MEFLGAITATPDPPGVSIDRWTQVISAQPNLSAVDPKMGINPFTREPLLYHPPVGTAWVVVDGSRVGMMTWAEDGTNRIAVFGDAGAVDRVALSVAAELDAIYDRGQVLA